MRMRQIRLRTALVAIALFAAGLQLFRWSHLMLRRSEFYATAVLHNRIVVSACQERVNDLRAIPGVPEEEIQYSLERGQQAEVELEACQMGVRFPWLEVRPTGYPAFLDDLPHH